MGKEFDKILEILEEIDKILSVAAGITPFPQQNLTIYELSLSSIRLQVNSTPEEDQSLEAVQRILKRVSNHEALARNILISHFNQNKIWNPTDDKSQLPLAELKILVEKQAEQIKKQNLLTLKSLKRLYQRISANDAPQELLAECNLILQRLEKSPASPVAQERIDELKEKAKPYNTRTQKIVILPEEIPVNESPFLKTIETLRKQLQEVIDAHLVLAAKEFSPDHAQDYLLPDWVKEYTEKTAAADNSRTFINNRIRDTLEHLDYHEILIGQLKKTIAVLQETNQQREELLNKILPRQALLYPAEENLVELDKLFLVAKTTLKKHFETFLLMFSVVDVNNKEDKDTQFFIQQLLQFINEIKQKFSDNPGIVNNKAIDNLHSQLLMHLGEKKRYFIWTTPLSKMESKDITELSNALFDVALPTQLDSQFYKKQIASFYNLAAIIEAFPIQPIKDYQILKIINDDEHKKILSEERLLLSDIEATTNELSEYFDLLPEEIGDNEIYQPARQLILKLHELRSNSEEQSNDYVESREQLFKEISPLARVHNLSTRQEERLKQLQQTRDALAIYQKEATPLIAKLENKFTQRKGTLKDTLENTLVNAKAALEFTRSHPNLNLNEQEKINFDTAIQSAQELLNSVHGYKEHIYQLKGNVAARINQLNLNIGIVKSKLKTYIEPDYKEAIRLYHRERLPILHPENPLQSKMDEAVIKTREVLNQLDKAFEKTDGLQGSELKQWYANWSMYSRQFEQHLSHRNQVIHDAKVIEQRLKTTAYTTSRSILNKLEEEFKRVTIKYVDQAIRKASGNDIVQLKALKAKPKLPPDASLAKSLLDQIDPRLHTLAQMHDEFIKINKKYINENLALSNDKDYFKQLNQSVMTHFKNNEMEKLSDGVRHKWVQFIRVNVFKPLQALTFNVSNYLKSKSQELFFVTLGACRTEKELVEFGHNVASTLAASAA